MDPVADLSASVEFLKSKGLNVLMLEKIEKLSQITVVCIQKEIFSKETWLKIDDILTDSYLIENINYDEDLSVLPELFLFCFASFLKDNNLYYNYIFKSIEKTKLNYFDQLKGKKHEFKFDQKIKMQGSVREFQNEFKITICGDIQQLLKRSAYILKNGKKEEMKESEFDFILNKSKQYVNDCKRVYGFAIANVLKDTNLECVSLEEFEFCFVGLFTITENLYLDSKVYIEKLEKLNIKPIIFTFNNVEMTFAMMKKLKLLNESQKNDVIQGVYSGENLDEEREFYEKIFIKKYSAFARLGPDEILKLVRYLSVKGEKVALISDMSASIPAIMYSEVAIATKCRTNILNSPSHFLFTENNILPVLAEIFNYFRNK